MRYLSILVIPYALWRIYVNHKSNIKFGPEISLAVVALVTIIANAFFKDSLFVAISQLGLAFLITLYMIRTNRQSN